MNNVYHDIFKAIHEGKWLRIEYENKEGKISKYWIGIRDLDVRRRSLAVDGLHLRQYTTDSYDCIYIDSIQSSQVVEGSYCPVNQRLVEDIYLNPHKYKTLFDNTANLKILNYLEMCNRMDTIPYYSDFKLIRFLDRESFTGEAYQLSNEQFQRIVQHFQHKMDEKPRKDGKLVIQQLAMNVLSIHTSKGLYVLAYRKLQLDVKRRVLRPEPEISICTEYMMGDTKENIRKYLDAEEYELLGDFEKNQEKIKDCVTRHTRQVMGVDDMPYIIGLGMDVVLDLHKEYQAIIQRYQEGNATIPIKAFFGDLVSRPVRRKEYPITLVNRNINMDQLLAINTGMKYPVAYIQGPPGTGKTNTIINTIVTAFFNERTVLFTSYNIWLSQNRFTIQKEVAISQVFADNPGYNDLFYSGRFDFVVYERQGRQDMPVLAIELDGKEHFEDEVVKARDRKKNAICRAHNLQIIRVENSYARRYNHIKEILMSYFSARR